MKLQQDISKRVEEKITKDQRRYFLQVLLCSVAACIDAAAVRACCEEHIRCLYSCSRTSPSARRRRSPKISGATSCRCCHCWRSL